MKKTLKINLEVLKVLTANEGRKVQGGVDSVPDMLGGRIVSSAI